MSTADTKPASMNEASEHDPFNNNSFGTIVDDGYKQVSLPILDVDDFNDHIIRNEKDLERVRKYIRQNPEAWVFGKGG